MLPDVSYRATAVRPQWSDLPESLREAIGAHLGGPIAAAHNAGGGFTRAFAAVVETTAGFRAFIKAAPLREPIAEWYARESSITAALPPAVAAARPRWTMTDSGYFVLCLDYVDGRIPSLPWVPAELEAAVSAWTTAAAALAEPSLSGLPLLPDIVRDEMSVWSSETSFGLVPADLPIARLSDLVALERLLPDAVAGTGMLHGDLRIDNVLIDRSGAAWLCDWTWPCVGAPWFDLVTLLVTAYASGAEADRFLTGAPAEGVDAALAGLAGYWLARAAGPPSSASPHSRQHQAYSGRAALSWLAARRGWS
jgi:aminoglycoside phosphotransferase (APT) family kinase protein